MKVFLACSASNSLAKEYYELACNVSEIFAKRGHKLVFGGFDKGMMEKCYMTFKYNESRVKAVATVADSEYIEDLELDAKEIVPKTFDRTKRLYEIADVIVILPGGIGTIAEFFSMLDYCRCSNYDKKPIILFNYHDYYTPIINMLKGMYESNFCNKNDLKEFNIITNIDGLEFYLKQLELDEKGEK